MKSGFKSGRIALVVAACWTTGAGTLHAAENADRAARQCRTVQANQAWQGTGVTVSPGQFVCVAADGLWSHGYQGLQTLTPFYGPEGFGKDDPANVPEVVSRVGALIGKIGTNAPFLVERQLCFIPGAAGELMLSMNDDPGAFGNNVGKMYVQILEWTGTGSTPDRIDLNPQACRPR
jgi:hypothetical protein